MPDARKPRDREKLWAPSLLAGGEAIQNPTAILDCFVAARPAMTTLSAHENKSGPGRSGPRASGSHEAIKRTTPRTSYGDFRRRLSPGRTAGSKMAKASERHILISEESALHVAAHILACGKVSPDEDIANQKIIARLIELIARLPEASPRLLNCLSDCAHFMKMRGHENHFAEAKIYAERQRRSKRAAPSKPRS